jgi:hypothetical protein
VPKIFSIRARTRWIGAFHASSRAQVSYDAREKMKGRKRHAMEGPKATPAGWYGDGRGLTLDTHSADIQEVAAGRR